MHGDAEYGLSFETRYSENDLSTPNPSRRHSSVVARMALQLSAFRIDGCFSPC